MTLPWINQQAMNRQPEPFRGAWQSGAVRPGPLPLFSSPSHSRRSSRPKTVEYPCFHPYMLLTEPRIALSKQPGQTC